MAFAFGDGATTALVLTTISPGSGSDSSPEVDDDLEELTLFFLGDLGSALTNCFIFDLCSISFSFLILISGTVGSSGVTATSGGATDTGGGGVKSAAKVTGGRLSCLREEGAGEDRGRGGSSVKSPTLSKYSMLLWPGLTC